MARAEKVNTETAAQMEARIRREVEAEYQAKAAAPAAGGMAVARAAAARELAAFLKGLPEKPRYRLLDKAYINDILYEPELKPWIPNSDPPEREPLVITFEGRPGPHMKPMNKAAEMMYEKYPPAGGDPIQDLSIVSADGEAAVKKMTTL